MFTRPSKILIIDDDAELVTLLTDYLTLEGFSVTPAHNGLDGLSALAKEEFDLVVLDVMMPGMSGTEVLQKIRERSQTPVLMLTARGDPVDRILGLELGADDYVPKPCPPRELVARMRAILRRSKNSSQTQTVVTAGPMRIDSSKRRIYINDKEASFTGTEFSLLETLARQAGQPVAKSDIYPRVLGRPMGRYDRSIDVHVSAIRHKLAQACGSAITIESVRGIGYQLIVQDDNSQG
ncbi:MAG TPA: DNA-binding response regulator [Sutterella sp.]|nr:DNA-binding response regulator [Sutterella sp.]